MPASALVYVSHELGDFASWSANMTPLVIAMIKKTMICHQYFLTRNPSDLLDCFGFVSINVYFGFSGSIALSKLASSGLMRKK